ncbi:MAG: glycosyltransferase family 4 protein [Halieaceae bacterium]|nr:glycosyltransferase family 4 protein [Halieaceae bacterium]
MVALYPLFQPFIENALGVVVHSDSARDVLAKQFPEGPKVIKLDLPYAQSRAAVERDFHAQQLQFVFCGHVGSNRRLAEFFKAWGQLEHPDRIRLDIFGNYGNTSQLERLAQRFGVSRWLDFRGYVEDEALEQSLREAHFALNLRWPTMGEASASQLRYWSAALPTLVTDVGWYGELPDDTVCKVSRDNEVESLRERLQDIVDSPGRYAAVGVAGWQYLKSQHSPQTYARKLIHFAEHCTNARLGYQMVDKALVNTVASMCEDESVLRLFREPVDTARTMFDQHTSVR